MLSAGDLWGEPVAPFFSPNVTAHVASEPWHFDGYFDLRRRIFAEEQGLFDVSDVDEHDAVAVPIVAFGHVAGMPDEVSGCVRIYPTEGGTWFGGRLGVSRRYRSRGVVGTALICAAVSTALARGCRRFLATIQSKNVPYFERHHFSSIRPVDVCGQPHRLMEACLIAYPPREASSRQPVDDAVVAELFGSLRAA
jgi:putative N-acetyltransferase (TIGR04045 family)